MGRRKINNNKKRSKNGGNSFTRADVVRVHARVLNPTNAMSAGLASLAINPSSFPQALEVADDYQFYRVTKLRYKLLVPPTAYTTPAAMVYIPGITDNQPANNQIIMSVPHSQVFSCNQTVPNQWTNVPAVALKSYMPWFKTIVGSPDPAEETQGTVYFANTGTVNVPYLIEAIFEFRETVTSSITPAMRGKLECDVERARILRLLSTPAPAITSDQLAGRPGFCPALPCSMPPNG